MNKSLQKLYEIGRKSERMIVGLMSGTSLDGLDIALCRVKDSGLNTKVIVEHFETISYSEEYKNIIRKIFSNKDAALQDVCIIHKWLSDIHAKMVNDFLSKWNIPKEKIDLIASHGQTVFHAPGENFHHQKINSTFQIVDGDTLAHLTGIITISDFRQKHIAAGGEGAPLALYGDYILFGNSDTDTILLNIGGIANLTFISSDKKTILCTDTGPGNTLMDAWMQKKYNLPMDHDSSIATSGKINKSLLDTFLQHPFFKKAFPKTCGQETFNFQFIERSIESIETKIVLEDVMATLNALTSEIISAAIHSLTSNKYDIYISGGGIYNTTLMNSLRQTLTSATFCSTDSLGISPDAKEAVLFAILANEQVAGDISTFTNAGIFPAVGFGKISFAD